MLNKHGIQRPPCTNTRCFSLQDGGWAPFVSLSSIFDQGTSINAGFAVNKWRPTHFQKGVNWATGGAVDNVFNVFTGITADLAVRDTDALF